MLEIEIPGRETIRAERLVLDINGTLTVDGGLLPGVAERIEKLRRHIEITLVSADTFGTAPAVAAALGVRLVNLAPGEGGAQKLALVQGWGPSRVIAIGNGVNDAPMLEAAALGLAVIQAEGAATWAIRAADAVFGLVCAALDALLFPSRLVATLRK